MNPTLSLTPETIISTAMGQHAMYRDTIGNFLLRRLHEIGLRHLFGVPGDFNLLFLDQVEAFDGIQWVGNCNELNAAYAADGYGRSIGISALLTTYGVGELSALNGIAGAYAERVPMVVITGAPPSPSVAKRLAVHHSLGDGNFDNTLAAITPFTVAQARLTPQNFVSEIDRCLTMCLLEKRPVYLQLPSDFATMIGMVPQGALQMPETGSDPVMLSAFVEKAQSVLAQSISPAVLIDADVDRFHLAESLQNFLDASGLPVAAMGTAKGVLYEKQAQFIGLYNGAMSKPQTREIIEGSDCLLTFGLRFLDATTGAFTQQIDASRQIEIRDWSARIGRNEYYGIRMSDVLSALTDALSDRLVYPAAQAETSLSGTDGQSTQTPGIIAHADFWPRIQSLLQCGDVLIAENGTPMSGMMGLQLPSDTKVIVQPLWGSIGYTLPATLGAMMAQPERRHLLFIGDGSFQLVAQELSTMLREGLKPVIFLINNDGYTIERLIHGKTARYNDIQPWQYSKLCEIFAPSVPVHSVRVDSLASLDAALIAVNTPDRPIFIEVMMAPMDAPASLQKLGPMFAHQSYGLKWAMEQANI